MARRIYSEDLVLNLIVNGQGTKQGTSKAMLELHNLERQALEAEMKLQKVELAIRKLDKGSADYTVRLKQLNAEKRKLTKEITALNAKINEQRMVVGKSGMTINQLNSYLKTLNIQLRNAGPTQQAYMAGLRKEITQVENRIRHLTTGASRMSIAFERMGTVANKFGTIMSWAAISTYLVARAVGSTVGNLRSLDKMFSAVMKTTGLTRAEMWRLKEVFDEMNKPGEMKTPTTTMELLEIARIAGRLGVRGVEDVAAFTLAVDKLYVSLGEDLKGSVEEVAEKVGKLVNVFRLTEEMPLNEALLRAGSLINELGKRSAASAETVLNYTARLGGVGSMAKFTIDQLAGLGAALDAMNVPAERGSTALVKLITGLGHHAEKFSRILGVTIDEYRTMIETDVNGVLMAMLEASRAGNESIMGVVESMGDMEVSGVRVAEVFGKLTQNIEFVREQQEIARVAFESSASVMNEYYIVSRDFNSLMAVEGKRTKAMADQYSKAVAPAVYKVYRGFLDFIEAMRDGVVWIAKHNYLIKAMTALWVAFKAQKIAIFLSELIITFRLWVGDIWRATTAKLANIAATKAMTAAYATAGGGIKGLTAALRVLWATMLANPMTALIAILGLAASAIFLFGKKTDEVTKAISGLGTEIERETEKMNASFEAAKKTTEGTKERILAIKLLNERYGEYLPKLLSEKSSLEDIKIAQDLANDSLREAIALKWRDSEFERINQGYRDKRAKMMERFYARVLEKGGATMQGLAKFETEELIEQVVIFREQGGDPNKAFEMVDEFRKKWADLGIMTGDLNSMIFRTVDLYERQRTSIKQLDESTGEYLRNLRARGGQTLKEAEKWNTMPEEVYNNTKASIELRFEMEKNALQQRMINEKSGEEWLNKEILKVEETMLRDLLKLENEKWTKSREIDIDGVKTREEVLIGGEKDINDAMIRLNENLIKQMKEPKAKAVSKKEADAWKKEIKDIYTEIEIEYQRAYLTGQMNKETFDRLMFELELEYKRHLLQELRTRGEETLDLENEIWGMRIKQQEKMAADAQKIQKVIQDILYPKKRADVKDDPDFDQQTQDIADRLLKQKQRIRQFLGLERDEELEPGFAAFEVSNFAEQFKKIEEWYKRGIINHEEYERRKTDITKAQTKERAKITGELLGQVDQLLSAYGQLQRARMEQELEAVGDNEAAKNRIRMEYAEREKKVAMAQAVISGALSVMRILEGKISGNPLIDSIIKGVLIAATVATTGMQIKTIKAQQFAKGNYPQSAERSPDSYRGQSAKRKALSAEGGALSARERYPVMGADDGRVYDARYVGPVQTGVYREPSLGLFAERPEMVIDWPTLRKIQLDNPRLIDAILAYRGGAHSAKRNPDSYRGQSAKGGAQPRYLSGEDRVRQYARGNWPEGGAQRAESIAQSAEREAQGELLVELLRENRDLLKVLKNWKPKVYTEMIKKDLDNLENINRNRGM